MTPLLHSIPSTTRFSVIKSGQNLCRKQRRVGGVAPLFVVRGEGVPPPLCHSLNSGSLPHFYAGDYAKNGMMTRPEQYAGKAAIGAA